MSSGTMGVRVGYRTFVGFVKETGLGVVLLTNSFTGSDDIGFHLLDPGSELADLKSGTQAADVAESTLEGIRRGV